MAMNASWQASGYEKPGREERVRPRRLRFERDNKAYLKAAAEPRMSSSEFPPVAFRRRRASLGSVRRRRSRGQTRRRLSKEERDEAHSFHRLDILKDSGDLGKELREREAETPMARPRRRIRKVEERFDDFEVRK
jgi:hypothetical protein